MWRAALCRYWFYELVDMFRRISLTAVVLFVPEGEAQLVAGMALAFIAVSIHQVCTWVLSAIGGVAPQPRVLYSHDCNQLCATSAPVVRRL